MHCSGTSKSSWLGSLTCREGCECSLRLLVPAPCGASLLQDNLVIASHGRRSAERVPSGCAYQPLAGRDWAALQQLPCRQCCTGAAGGVAPGLGHMWKLTGASADDMAEIRKSLRSRVVQTELHCWPKRGGRCGARAAGPMVGNPCPKAVCPRCSVFAINLAIPARNLQAAANAPRARHRHWRAQRAGRGTPVQVRDTLFKASKQEGRPPSDRVGAQRRRCTPAAPALVTGTQPPLPAPLFSSCCRP